MNIAVGQATVTGGIGEIEEVGAIPSVTARNARIDPAAVIDRNKSIVRKRRTVPSALTVVNAPTGLSAPNDQTAPAADETEKPANPFLRPASHITETVDVWRVS